MSTLASGIALDLVLVGLPGLAEFSGVQIVGGSDRQLLPFTGVIPQLESSGEVFARASSLGEAVIFAAYRHEAHGEVGIELNGALMMRQSRGRALLTVGSLPEAVRFQSFERRCRRMLQWNPKLP